MKMLVFGAVADEKRKLLDLNVQAGEDAVDRIEFATGILELGTAHLTKGFDCVWVTSNSQVDRRICEILSRNGVKYVVSRSTGYWHLDLNALREFGISASHVLGYAPAAISEHTIMMLLFLLRKMKKGMKKTDAYDYTLDGICSRGLSSMTVGIYGTGRIGCKTIQALAGFGCRILAFSLHQREEMAHLAEYVTEEELFRNSDAILLHCPLVDSTYHLIDQERIAQMKDGAILINTARGGLVDSRAVLKALDCGKLSGYGFDACEEERTFIRKSFLSPDFNASVFLELCRRDDVIYTEHRAFYTEEAVQILLQQCLGNAIEYQKTGKCSNEIKYQPYSLS